MQKTTAYDLLAEVRRLVTLHDETEWVAYRVQEYPESLAWLVLGLSTSNAQNVTFSVVEIVNLEVEMDLFRDVPIGPGGSDIVLDSLKAQGRQDVMNQIDVCHIFRGVTRPSLYRDTREGRVELRELERVGTVKQDKVQSWKFHTATVCRTSICRPAA
jgi:hypothetical protein